MPSMPSMPVNGGSLRLTPSQSCHAVTVTVTPRALRPVTRGVTQHPAALIGVRRAMRRNASVRKVPGS